MFCNQNQFIAMIIVACDSNVFCGCVLFLFQAFMYFYEEKKNTGFGTLLWVTNMLILFSIIAKRKKKVGFNFLGQARERIKIYFIDFFG